MISFVVSLLYILLLVVIAGDCELHVICGWLWWVVVLVFVVGVFFVAGYCTVLDFGYLFWFGLVFAVIGL